MIYSNEAISLALIYIYRATGAASDMVRLEQAQEYAKIINNNLREMNSTVHNLTPDSQIRYKDLFFFYAEDIEENGYYVLKKDEISIAKRQNYIVGLPLDVVIASQMPNALEALGLELVDKQIRKKAVNKDLVREKRID